MAEDEVATIDESVGTPRATRHASAPDRYKLNGLLGAGGMGEVFAARDEQIGRDVAVKRMKAKDPTERQVARFIREAQLQGRLEHPAIAPVHELGRDADGRPFFAMKKLAGRTLAELLREAPRQRLLRAFVEVCLAVELAHTRGVVHRDLKPENIVLGDFGEVYVLDWGIAKLLGEAHDAEGIASDDNLDATLENSSVGTPGYMSPEQVEGQASLDARSDIYSLGCVLFEILTGEPLHPRGNVGMASAAQGLANASPSTRKPDREIPPELDTLCVTATAMSPADRVQTARALGDRVQEYLDGDRDVLHRKALALEHLERARRADEPPVAMREAGRALALDPTLDAAADLVSRLMLEPPREVPPEVQAEMLAEDRRDLSGIAGGVARSYLSYFILLPVLLTRAPVVDTVVFYSIVVVTMAMALAVVKHGRATIGAFALMIAFTQGALAHLMSPVGMAPGLIAFNAVILLITMPSTRRTRIIAMACMLGGIAVPWIGELVGILPRTYTVGDDGIALIAPLMRGDAVVTMSILAFSIVVIILIAIELAYRVRKQYEAARLGLHVQAWRLRQLAPL